MSKKQTEQHKTRNDGLSATVPLTPRGPRENILYTAKNERQTVQDQGADRP